MSPCVSSSFSTGMRARTIFFVPSVYAPIRCMPILLVNFGFASAAGAVREQARNAAQAAAMPRIRIIESPPVVSCPYR